MAQRIVTDDLDRTWFHTKWVPHTLTENNKAVRVERSQDLIETFSGRLCKYNLVTVDEKFFYCRKMRARNKIGSWLSAAGDEKVVQTASRTNMEKKFLAIVAVSQRGNHYYEVLPHGESLNSERYIEFLNNLQDHLRTQRPPILPENMRLIQDNARPHVARTTIEYIEDSNIRLLRQPPYSPDLNLCDRYVFPRLESLTPDFRSMDDVSRFLTEQLPQFTANRMNKAVDVFPRLESLTPDFRSQNNCRNSPRIE